MKRRTEPTDFDRVESSRATLLQSTLELAVPQWIDRVREWTPEHRAEQAQKSGQHIAEHGDVVLYKSKKKGETAEAFNQLAVGLAVLAFAPGGVRFMGLHFEAVKADAS